uniref:Putative ovule protein n=1 Tax=Solanum chacoense TaxID=4108 RepID=A0A0V0GQ53_SOLCH
MHVHRLSLCHTSLSPSIVKLLNSAIVLWKEAIISISLSFKCLLSCKFQACPVHIAATVACCCWHRESNAGYTCFKGVLPIHLSFQSEP